MPVIAPFMVTSHEPPSPPLVRRRLHLAAVLHQPRHQRRAAANSRLLPPRRVQRPRRPPGGGRDDLVGQRLAGNSLDAVLVLRPRLRGRPGGDGGGTLGGGGGGGVSSAPSRPSSPRPTCPGSRSSDRPARRLPIRTRSASLRAFSKISRSRSVGWYPRPASLACSSQYPDPCDPPRAPTSDDASCAGPWSV